MTPNSSSVDARVAPPSRPWLGFAAVLLAALALAALVHVRAQQEVASERAAYRAEAAARTRSVVVAVNDTLQQIYRAIRTIARLPGIRGIDRHGHRVDDDARASVQEIFDSLASGVPVAEVHIVPLDMHPDHLDAVTGRLEEPIMTISARRTAGSGGAARAVALAGSSVAGNEYHEYRLMQRQMAIFAALHPREDGLDRSSYPVVTGPEVITCDTSRLRRAAPNDRERSGLVLSVPFYGRDGALRGQVSAVILSRALRDLLPDGHYALRHTAHDFLVGSRQETTWASARRHVAANQTDPGRIYSEVVALGLPDLQGPWYVWAGEPDSAFWSRGGVRAARRAALLGYALIAAVAVSACLGLLHLRHRRLCAGTRRA